MNTSIFFNKSFRFAALASVVTIGALSASNSFAAKAGSADSTATVIEPIAITNTADLDFGKFAPGGGGNVVVATNGDRTTTGPILSSIGSSPTAATFTVTGDNDATYGITWTGGTELSDSESTPNTMDLGKISDVSTSGGTATNDVLAGTLSGSGEQSIFLGGVLSVADLQPAGEYTGTVTATVEYN